VSAQDSSNWAIITAVCAAAPIVGALIVAVLQRYFVTRGELKEAIEKLDGKVDRRHDESGGRFTRQDEELKEIRKDAAATRAIAARLEGLATTGKFPRIGQ